MSPQEILNILELEYPNPDSELDHKNVFELLIAVTLSAQATDVSVNKVTPALFEAYPDVFALAKADIKEVASLIRTLGLYRNKAKYIVEASKMLVEEYEGVVPNNRDDLMRLPGVGRKTANVVLAVGFNQPAIAVDTHVERVTKRLGWASESASVLEVENVLMSKFDRRDWAKAHYLLLLFGRYHATARNKQDVYLLLNQLKEKHTR